MNTTLPLVRTEADRRLEGSDGSCEVNDLPDVVKFNLLLDEAWIADAVYPLTVPATIEFDA